MERKKASDFPQELLTLFDGYVHGRMSRRDFMDGAQKFAVAVGDTICIAPGTPHCIVNTGDTPLRILCTCSPAYSHDDTVLIDADSER